MTIEGSHERQKMRPMTWGPRRKGKCRGCRKPIEFLQDYFYDKLGDCDYCEQCGRILRFHRRKAEERGEELPLDQATVDAEFERLGIITKRG